MASEEHNTTVKRRAYRKKGWKYLLDDNDHTAWIAKGHIGRCRRLHLSYLTGLTSRMSAKVKEKQNTVLA